MMDKTYILENGLLELYVLGELNAIDQEQVEAAIIKHPELKLELDTIEASFENIAQENAIEAPVDVKSNLLSQVTSPSVKSISSSPTSAKPSYFSIAASIAALLFLGSIYMFTQLSKTRQQLEMVEQENKKLNRNIDNLNNYLAETNKWYVVINDPDVQKYVLTGNALMPEATVISYVNDQKKSVVINTKYLPKLDDEHDYQMWADVEGEMINMGIIEKNKDMLAMNYIDNAESLNITIEPAGGNDHPTVSQLITNIYLN